MIVFQSGRHYTQNGQRIAAELTPAGGILFADVDRMVNGHITPETVNRYKLVLGERDVMWAYDHHDMTKYWATVHEHEAAIKVLQAAARTCK